MLRMGPARSLCPERRVADCCVDIVISMPLPVVRSNNGERGLERVNTDFRNWEHAPEIKMRIAVV